MKKIQTKLMSRLFSETTPNEFKEDILNKIDEAKESGESSYSTEEDDIDFKVNEDGSVDMIDNINDEVTNVTENPEDESDLILTASETLPDRKVERVEGIDGEKLEGSVPNVQVDIEPAITDEGKAGIKNFSIKFFGTSKFSDAYKMSKAIIKAFSECPIAATEENLRKAATEALEDTDPYKDNKAFAEAEELANTISENANQLAQAVDDLEGTGDVELAKNIKAMCDKLLSDLDRVDSDMIDTEEVKSQCKKFAEKAESVIEANENPTESPTEAPTEAATEAPTEAATEEPTEAPTEAVTEAPTEAPTEAATEEPTKSAEKSSDEKKAELKEKADEIAEKAESMTTESEAEEVKQMTDELNGDLENAENEGIDVEEIKEMSKKFSEKVDSILNKTVRSFSKSPYMNVGRMAAPVVNPSQDQRLFSKSNQVDKRKSLNPYLYNK